MKLVESYHREPRYWAQLFWEVGKVSALRIVAGRMKRSRTVLARSLGGTYVMAGMPKQRTIAWFAARAPSQPSVLQRVHSSGVSAKG